MHKRQWIVTGVLALVLLLMPACTQAEMAAWQEAAAAAQDSGPAMGADVVVDEVIDEEMDAYLQAQVATGRFMGSVLVARGDEVIHSAGYGYADLEHDVPNFPEIKFRLGSLTKQFTAAAILQLQDAGLVDVAEPISIYLPDYPGGEQITVENLLAHTSGIPNFTSFPDYAETMSEPTTLDELIARFSDMPLEFEPGSQFNYSNSNYVLLSAIIEAVSGQSYAEYMEQQLFVPLGLDSTGYEEPYAIIEDQAAGYVPAADSYMHAQFIHMSVPSGAGALYSTVLDLHEWWQLLRDGEVLSAEAREQFFTPVIEIPGEGGYAYGWQIDTLFGRPVIAHSGGINGFQSYMLVFPAAGDTAGETEDAIAEESTEESAEGSAEESAVVIVLSNVESAPSASIAQDLSAILYGEPYELPVVRTAIEVDPEILARYEGRYVAESGFDVTVTLEDGQLYAQPVGQPRLPLYPESETEFFLREVDAQVRFEVDENGEVTGLVLTQAGETIEMPRVE